MRQEHFLQPPHAPTLCKWLQLKHKSLESEVPSQQGLGNPFLANQVPVSKDKGFPISTATIITPQQADQNAQYTGKDDLREFGDYEDKNKGLQKAIKILNLKHTTGLEERSKKNF